MEKALRAASGSRLEEWLMAGAGAGLAGGLAEVVFMAAYGAAADMSGVKVLSLITYTFFGAAISFGPLGAMGGLVIHLILSVLIGVCFGAFMLAIHPDAGTASYQRAAVSGIVILTGIWAVNFFVLLPAVNPQFVAYVPLAAAFFSKLMFGISVGVFARLVNSHGAPHAAAAPEIFNGRFFPMRGR